MEIIELKIRDFDPLKFFQKLDGGDVAFLHSDKWSIIAWEPVKTVTSFDELQAETKKRRAYNPFDLPFCGGAIGYFSYDGDVCMNFYDKFLCYDGKKVFAPEMYAEDVDVIWGRDLDEKEFEGGLKFEPEFSESEYNQAFAKIKNYILEGDIYQVNLTYRFSADFDGAHRALFKKITEVNPAPFSAYLECGDLKLLSASPERFLELRSGRVKTSPIKGTCSRDEDPQRLLDSEKEAAELNMITDLLRNDIGQVCEIGTVEVTAHRKLQKCPTVWHTVSTVEGVLREGLDAVDLLKACLPGGSITGCPKKRAMEIIDELEPVKRGVYTGAIGYISDDGNMDTNIVIRTLVAQDGKLYLNVGGGIVADSDCRSEFQETLDKGKAFLNL